METRLADLRIAGLPKVLRGLPRLYKRQQREISKIKPEFEDFEINKRRYLEKAFLKDYADKKLPKNARVVLFTWVMEDGWGDYYTQLRAAEVLQEAFASLKISLITLLHKNRRLPKETHVFEQFVFFYTGSARSTIIHEAWSDDVILHLQTADLILQMPTYFPHTEALLKQCRGKPRYELVGECGFIDSAWFHPQTAAHCMGLHFLEKGLLFKKIPTHASTECFQLDYTKTKRGHTLFTHILLKALENNERDCRIATTSLQWIVEEMDSHLKPLCARFGVREVVIRFQDKVCVIPIVAKGKQLSFVYLEHLPQEQFLSYIAKTDCLVGCTGDGSFVDALATGKPFFYDPPVHKRNFLKDLIATAEDRLQAYPETVEFLRLSLKKEPTILEHIPGEWVSEEYLLAEQEKISLEDVQDDVLAEKMGTLLQHPRLSSGFQELSRIIQEEYSFNQTLCHLVLRSL